MARLPEPILPPEVLEQIIDQLFDDTAALKSSSLICSALYPRARMHLLRNVILKGPFFISTGPGQPTSLSLLSFGRRKEQIRNDCHAFYTYLENSPSRFHQLIRRLSIHLNMNETECTADHDHKMTLVEPALPLLLKSLGSLETLVVKRTVREEGSEIRQALRKALARVTIKEVVLQGNIDAEYMESLAPSLRSLTLDGRYSDDWNPQASYFLAGWHPYPCPVDAGIDPVYLESLIINEPNHSSAICGLVISGLLRESRIKLTKIRRLQIELGGSGQRRFDIYVESLIRGCPMVEWLSLEVKGDFIEGLSLDLKDWSEFATLKGLELKTRNMQPSWWEYPLISTSRALERLRLVYIISEPNKRREDFWRRLSDNLANGQLKLFQYVSIYIRIEGRLDGNDRLSSLDLDVLLLDDRWKRTAERDESCSGDTYLFEWSTN
ncbi:hypothetical protein VKT23_006251 [Stygiomarasmius scandens]|uniref:F-box domain-containing protein n=1 Tax=Marasmiellus scandens TaxID=2682957 RepID=A0ABR1JQ41_9AGAR